jgi:hypothetical protein
LHQHCSASYQAGLTQCSEVHGRPEDVAGCILACCWWVFSGWVDARDQVHQRNAEHTLHLIQQHMPVAVSRSC